MRTVYGIVWSGDGLAAQQTTVQGQDGPELRTMRWASPPEKVNAFQPKVIPVDVAHSGQPVGEVVHLERHHGNIWVVCHVVDEVDASVAVVVGDDIRRVPAPLYFSAQSTRSPSGFDDIELEAVSLVSRTARLGAQPVRFVDGDVALAARRVTDRHDHHLLTRAASTHYTRHGQAHRIVDLTPEDVYSSR